jgi:hypothetical protein
MLLPIAVISAVVLMFVLFLEIHQSLMDLCTRGYAVDFDLCPVPWAPAVFSALFCLGSALGGTLCIVAAYIVAPSARRRTVAVTAIAISGLALYLFFLHWWWQLFFGIISAFTAVWIISRGHPRLQPQNT